MWAGGELEFFEPLRVGDEMTRTSRIVDVTMKDRQHRLSCVFVSVEHLITTPRGTALRERQDIVLPRDVDRGRPAPAWQAPRRRPVAKTSRKSHIADPVLLFSVFGR